MQDHNAWAYIVRLWFWAVDSAPDGRLDGLLPADVEIAVQYRHQDGRCYAALVRAGFVDEAAPGEPVAIHDWDEWIGASLRAMEEAAEKSRVRKRTWRSNRRSTEPPRLLPPADVTGTGPPPEGDVPPMSPGRHAGQDAAGAGQDAPGTPLIKSDQSKPNQRDLSSPGAEAEWWVQRYRAVWNQVRGSFYGRGMADGRAANNLETILAELPLAARAAARARGDDMIRAFLSKSGREAQAKHPFSWFVTSFNDLRDEIVVAPERPRDGLPRELAPMQKGVPLPPELKSQLRPGGKV